LVLLHLQSNKNKNQKRISIFKMLQ